MTPLQELLTGNEVIDNQHLTLIAELQLLSNVMEEEIPPRRDQIFEFINFLRNHFTSHFDLEESLMHEVSYPDWMRHTDEHLRFFDTFIWHKAIIERDGATKDSVTKMVSALTLWLKEHVMGEDVKLAQFYRAAIQARRTQTGT